MQITVNNLGKRYNNEWIFKGLSYTFSSGEAYVVQGANGSGKSTLLQTLAGYIIPSAGEINYDHPAQKINTDNIFQQISIASPYLELIEEYSFAESIEFQGHFKPFLHGLDTKSIIDIAGFKQQADKPIKYFSSGMKQRAKLALAILADCPVLLLDEPISNLDKKVIAWYKDLVNEYALHKLTVVCSNQQTEEYTFCKHQLSIEDYK